MGHLSKNGIESDWIWSGLEKKHWNHIWPRAKKKATNIQYIAINSIPFPLPSSWWFHSEWSLCNSPCASQVTCIKKSHTRHTLWGNRNIHTCGHATLYLSTQKKIWCLLWPLRGKVVGRLSETVLCMLPNLVKPYIGFQHCKSPRVLHMHRKSRRATCICIYAKCRILF